MAEGLAQVAQKCPSIRSVILLGPPQKGFASFQEMVQDSGDMFNENLDVMNFYLQNCCIDHIDNIIRFLWLLVQG